MAIFALPAGRFSSALNDALRVVTIQVAVALLRYLNCDDGDSVKFFSEFDADFVLTLLYIVVGVLAYWLVVRSVVYFTTPVVVGVEDHDEEASAFEIE
jgi:uncharacterized MAPEG superfamily protein